MKQRIKVSDYANQMQVSLSTIYRQVKVGKLESETIDGVLYVLIDEEQMQIEKQSDVIIELKERIEQQQTEIEYLRNELSEARQIIQQMQQDAAEAQQRSDTILLQLTMQKKGFFERLFRRKSLEKPKEYEQSAFVAVG